MIEKNKFALIFIISSILYVPVIFNLISTNLNIIFQIINLIIILIIPGFFLTLNISKKYEMTVDYFLAINITLSMSISLITCVLLTYVFDNISYFILSTFIFIISFIFGIINDIEIDDLIVKKKDIKDNLFLILIFILIFIISFKIIQGVIPDNYWRGWDPWINVPIGNNIINFGFNPHESTYAPRISGFWYFFSSLQVFTGISFDVLNRYGGPFLGGIVCTFIYLIIKKTEGNFPSLISIIFLFLTPSFINRFSMTLRENYAYVLFLSLFIIFNLIPFNNIKNKSFIIALGLIIGSIISSHSLTAFICLGTIFYMIFIQNKFQDLYLELIEILIISLIVSLPFIWIRDIELFVIFTDILIIITLSIFYKTNFKKMYYDKYIKPLFTNKIFLITMLSTTLYLIIFNKIINISDYSPFLIITSTIGILSGLFFKKSDLIISFSGFLIILLNLYWINLPFPFDRLDIYILFALTYFSTTLFGIVYSINIEKVKESGNKFKIIFQKNDFKLIQNKNIKIIVIILMIIIPAISEYNNFINVTKNWNYSSFTKEEIDSTKTLLEKYDNEIIIPQKWTKVLLNYAGFNVSKIIYNQTILNEIYNIKSYENLSYILNKYYPNNNEFIFFSIQRLTLKRPTYYLSIPEDILQLVSKKEILGNITYYKFNLKYIDTKSILSESISLKLPSGTTQNIILKINNLDINNTQYLSFSILNRGDSKQFYIQFKDVHGLSSEKIWYNLKNGNCTYYFSDLYFSDYRGNIHKIKENLDLKKEIEITFVFSWVSNKEIDLSLNDFSIIYLKEND